MNLKFFLELFESIGYMFFCLIRLFNSVLRKTINLKEFWKHVIEVSWASVFIIALTTLTVGMIISLQFTKQFQSFGALNQIGGANAVIQFRELSPVITAIILIGRIGSSWSAEIGSMKITEQISALKVMKVRLNCFPVSPRVLSCLIAFPILNLLAIIFSLSGGFLVANLISGLGLDSYLLSIREQASIYDFMVSLLKSLIFGLLVASVSCFYGLKAEGGSSGVGQYTTKAVVQSLVLLFCLDYILSYLFFAILQ